MHSPAQNQQIASFCMSINSYFVETPFLRLYSYSGNPFVLSIYLHVKLIECRDNKQPTVFDQQQMSKQTHAVKFCFFFKRIFRIRVAEPPEEVQNIFNRYSSEPGSMSLDDLQRFLRDYQKEKEADATEEHAQEIFNSLKHLYNHIFHRRGLHLDAFFKYLVGDHNTPLSSKVDHDMDAPLAHYFLFTGHNSYLTGNQLSSDSSVDPIINALRRGVRVIELDLWPSKNNKNVEVCHGGTLTSPVDLIKCLRAIKDNAFVASEYPVVITFEDHLTPDLQKRVAKMVNKTFGDMIYKGEHNDVFPSPKELKGKILISTKPPEEYLEAEDDKEKSTTSSMTEVPQISDTINKDQLDGEFTEEEDENKAAPVYRNLIAIHATKLKGRIESHWQDLQQNKVTRLSMSEQQLEKAIKTHKEEIIKFTQSNILRIYPRGTRILSSNYNPYVGWEHGAQMVAFNMQGADKYLWIMQGMFRANGGCGYVKKPKFLLENNPKNIIQKSLKVKLYQGEGWHLDFLPASFDLCSPPDLFIEISTVGVPADEHKFATKRVKDEWVPTWNEDFEFPLTVPELAVLYIQVFDYDSSGTNDFAGQSCLPISALKSGIRAVPLYDEKGNQYKHTRLLMRFEFDH